MVHLKDLITFLDDLLDIDSVPADSSNNGLQVEGSEKIYKIIFAVDACLSLSKISSEMDADFIFVHHGLSWREGFKRLTGHSAKIFSNLFKNDVSLYAAHLPLDAHQEVGHNIQIANLLDLNNVSPFCKYAKVDIGIMGELVKPTPVNEFKKSVDEKLNSDSKVYGNIRKMISKIGIISGGPGSLGIESAHENKLDCLITGEIGHVSWHIINDLDLTVIESGHYRTETPGIIAVMEKVKNRFNVECHFIDLPTGL